MRMLVIKFLLSLLVKLLVGSKAVWNGGLGLLVTDLSLVILDHGYERHSQS